MQKNNTNRNVSVIIINYNVASEVDACIESLSVFLPAGSEIIVADNNSSDRGIELLKEKYPLVKFIFLEDNLGFANANNIAVEKTSGNFILFLNPDTIIIEDFISPIITFMENNPASGTCGPKLVNEDHSYQYSNGMRLGYIYEFCEAFMLIGILRFLYRKLFLEMQSESPVKVSWLSAACLLVSKEVFLESGKFNPEFFLNYEDIDLCERIRKSGYQNLYFKELKCVHLDQKSQRKNLERLVFSRYTGRLIYAKNHYKPLKRSIIKLMHLAGLALRIIITPLLYKGDELDQRLNGYKKAVKLYS